MPDLPSNHVGEPKPPTVPAGRRTGAILLGGALALASVAGYWMWRAPAALPTVTRAEFDAAVVRWETSAPANYDVAVEVFGAQPALYRVQVRQGKPQSCTRDGDELKQSRTWRTWSVPGMFDTIHTDLARDPTGNEPVSVRAHFHPQLGYPERYQRVEWGANAEIEWRVAEFTIQP